MVFGALCVGAGAAEADAVAVAETDAEGASEAEGVAATEAEGAADAVSVAVTEAVGVEAVADVPASVLGLAAGPQATRNRTADKVQIFVNIASSLGRGLGEGSSLTPA